MEFLRFKSPIKDRLLSKLNHLLLFHFFLLGLASLHNSLQAQACLPEGFQIRNQEDIDEFIILTADCTEILGDIYIQDNFINDLSFISDITKINGSLIVNYCASLSSLSGLEQIEEIDGDFILLNLPLIESISPALSLKETGNLSITENVRLTDLDGLQQIEKVNGFLKIYQNNTLVSINGLAQLDQINGDLTIFNNNNLQSLHGLTFVKVINGDCWIKNNFLLSNLNGLERLSIVTGSLIVQDMQIKDLTGLGNLSVISKDFRIISNWSLKTLEGLDKLEFIGGKLSIHSNIRLKNLDALKSFGGKGLEELVIQQNHDLEDLNGLIESNIHYATYINISNNRSLSICAIQPLCTYLSTCQEIDIENNGANCSSKISLEKSCSLRESLDFNYQCNIKVFPNPAQSNLTISIEGRDEYGVQCEIFDQLGRKVHSLSIFDTEQKGNIDIAFLPAGVYFLKLTSWKINHTVSFIKN